MTNKVFANAAIKFIVGFAIFCAVWGAFFLISIRLFPEHINIVASILAIGTPISYIPFFIFATGTTVESNQKAVPVNVIRNELEAINSYDTPIVVEKENNNKYVLTWRYKDSKWHGFMSKSGMTHTYQLIVKLNEAKKQATVINVYRKILWQRSD